MLLTCVVAWWTDAGAVVESVDSLSSDQRAWSLLQRQHRALRTDQGRTASELRGLQVGTYDYPSTLRTQLLPTRAYNTLPERSPDSPSDQVCLNEPNCNFFSHAALARSDYPSCAVCGACDIMADSVGQRFTSWLRGEQWLRLQPTVSASEAILMPLQGSYSTQLYGAEGRVPLRSLRFVWLSLLEKASLHSLTGVGVCKANARPPSRPFFWGIDTIANPVDASKCARS